MESYATFPRELAATATAALVAVPPPDDPALSGPADLLVGSKTQFPPSWREAPLESARAAMGERLRLVVITDGSRGAVAYGNATSCAVAAQPAQQVDATGAGDAFAAGLLHGLLEGWELRAAMELDAAWGAATVEELRSIPAGYRSGARRRGVGRWRADRDRCPAAGPGQEVPGQDQGCGIATAGGAGAIGTGMLGFGERAGGRGQLTVDQVSQRLSREHLGVPGQVEQVPARALRLVQQGDGVRGRPFDAQQRGDRLERDHLPAEGNLSPARRSHPAGQAERPPQQGKGGHGERPGGGPSDPGAEMP